MKRAWQLVTDTWCYIAHPNPMWPVNGYYRCPSCHRLYPVPWEKGGASRWDYQKQMSSRLDDWKKTTPVAGAAQ
jgi:hypothetical protein